MQIQKHIERQEIYNFKNSNTHKYKFHHWHSEPDKRRRKMRFFRKSPLTKKAVTNVPASKQD